MSGATVRCKFVPAARPAPGRAAPKVIRSPKPNGPSRSARMLALAHYIERLVEAGELTSYAEAARVLGLTRARLTQVMNLLLLAPEIQIRILAGESVGSAGLLRRAAGVPAWPDQAVLVGMVPTMC